MTVKCWICEQEIEQEEKVIEIEYRLGYMLDGMIETSIRFSPTVIHDDIDCKDKALHLIEQYWGNT